MSVLMEMPEKHNVFVDAHSNHQISSVRGLVRLDDTSSCGKPFLDRGRLKSMSTLEPKEAIVVRIEQQGYHSCLENLPGAGLPLL